MLIDLRTFFILLTLISGIMFLTFVIYFFNKKIKSNIITILLLTLTISNILFGLRNFIPDYLSMTIAASLLAITYSLSYMAVCRFFSLPVNKWAMIIPVFLMFFAVQPSYSYITRIVLSNPIYAIQNLILLYVLIKVMCAQKSKTVLLLIIFCFIGFTFFIIRTITSIIFREQYISLLESSILQSLIFTIIGIGLLFFVLGILLLQIESESDIVKQSNILYDKKNRVQYIKEPDLIKLYEDLIIARDNTLSSNRAKSAFLSNIGHEMRTPMNAILGFCEIIKMKSKDHAIEYYIDSIMMNGKILIQLINDILDIIKFENEQFILRTSQVNIRNILNEIPHFFNYELRNKNLEMFIHLDDSFPLEIEIDPLRIRQIMLNLSGNAVKFTSVGHVSLSVRHFYTNNKSKINLEIVVQDTGKGISSDNQEKIFTAFEQEENYSGNHGLGLGLSIVKKIVDAMNGSISIESYLDKGSTFRVSIPDISVISCQNDTVINNHASNTTTKKDNDKCILIVDDEPTNLYIYKNFIIDEGYRIICVSSGVEALTILDTVKPDLIIMDIKMPDMNGFETTRIIKNNSQFSDIPIIALTGMLLSSNDMNMVGTNFSSFLTKPCTKKNIVSEIKKYI